MSDIIVRPTSTGGVNNWFTSDESEIHTILGRNYTAYDFPDSLPVAYCEVLDANFEVNFPNPDIPDGSTITGFGVWICGKSAEEEYYQLQGTLHWSTDNWVFDIGLEPEMAWGGYTRSGQSISKANFTSLRVHVYNPEISPTKAMYVMYLKISYTEPSGRRRSIFW